MSKPQTRNRDYGYQPNMSEGVVDMESRVTTSGMAMAGKVEKHSEFMQPNNQSYDDMEYLYPGSGNDPWGNNNPAMNPIGPGRGWPGNPTDCKSLWNKLFPKHPTGTGAFIPNAQDNAALKQYVKAGCPVDYIPNFCCPDVKISGPKKVDGGSITPYSLINPKPNCDYTWSSSAGRIPGGTFYAPDGPTTVQISVYPFMGDDNSKKCDTISVQITTDGCAGETIGITTNQMSVGESQTFTIVGEVPGKSYTWNIASGGGTMSGSTYTAPASNPNCTSNSVIQLKVGTTVCASVSIAVTASTAPCEAALLECKYCNTEGGPVDYYQCYSYYNCAGVQLASPACGTSTGACTSGPPASCSAYTTSVVSDYIPWWHTPCVGPSGERRTGIIDIRTTAQKAAGCCPSQLL